MTAPLFARITIEAIARNRRPPDREAVARILERVKREGDGAVQAFALAFGDPVPRRIAPGECDAALERITPALRLALERMRDRVTRFAQAQYSALREFSYESDGLVMGQRTVALQSAGAYVPAGRHPLPSTAIMTVVPAQVAGVPRIAVCTPHASDAILSAFALLGLQEMYEMGGAQAIGAFAYGTQMVAPVDKIVGPGNAYVNEAKRQVIGVCGIDLLAGPSEVAVVATRDADSAAVARSMLAEAEHDCDSRAYLIVDSAEMADAVEEEVERQAKRLSAPEVALQAIASSGAIVCTSLAACVDAANALAIEHLELHGSGLESVRDRLTVYGALFTGLPAAFGDYGAGPNHTLPTGASARFSGGLSVYDFLMVRPFIERRSDVSRELVDDCAVLAGTEGLPAHEAAIAAA